MNKTVPSSGEPNSPIPGGSVLPVVEESSLQQMEGVRALTIALLHNRPAGAVPLGTLELLLGKLFGTAMAVDPERLPGSSDCTLDDYLKLVNACTRLADAFAKLELARVRHLDQATLPGLGGEFTGIPEPVLKEVERIIRLL